MFTPGGTATALAVRKEHAHVPPTRRSVRIYLCIQSGRFSSKLDDSLNMKRVRNVVEGKAGWTKMDGGTFYGSHTVGILTRSRGIVRISISFLLFYFRRE